MECDNCSCQWDLETHVPKILPCGHTVCLSCLYSLLDQSMNSISIGGSNFRCPLCQNELKKLSSKEDISNLKENHVLLTIADKFENTRKKNSNSLLSLSQNNNNDDCKSNTVKSKETGIQNCYYPICQIHQNKACYFYISDKNETNYVCTQCLKSNNFDNLQQLPSLYIQNEIKINACKSKTKLIVNELNRIEKFMLDYQKKFEIDSKKKIDDLFEYINKIIQYNYTTANTLVTQCKNEQKLAINDKINELNNLKNELNEYNNKLDEILNDELYKREIIDTEIQIDIDNIYNKLGNYLNYENKLGLFEIDVNINDDIKDNLFEIIQNAYEINVDYLKTKNGDIPSIKTLLKKNNNWTCECGNTENKIGKIICGNCKKYRSLETYDNILFNPLLITKEEIKEFHKRREHEEKIFNSFRNKHENKYEKKNRLLFAIDKSWFNKWKTYVINDLTEKILNNNKKYISDNKLVGVLPPGPINNENINGDILKNKYQYKIKSGLKIEKDYYAINQYLWEWFLLNYGGGPEIPLYAAHFHNNSKKEVKNNIRYDTIDNNGSIVIMDEKIDKDINRSNKIYREIIASERNKTPIKESINKINSVEVYKFQTKFVDFKKHNPSCKKIKNNSGKIPRVLEKKTSK